MLYLIDQNGNWFYNNQQFVNNSFQQPNCLCLTITGTYYVRYSYDGNYNGAPAKEQQNIKIAQKKNPDCIKRASVRYL